MKDIQVQVNNNRLAYHIQHDRNVAENAMHIVKIIVISLLY